MLSIVRFESSKKVVEIILSLNLSNVYPGTRVDVKIPQEDGNRADVNGHVEMVHGHVWRTLYASVCATGVRVFD
tara:strand:- start:278 stop:499 length:222 start_codon:yes stop_codon:yes gene_type:complete